MDHIDKLLKQLERRANPKTKAWWEHYLKHTIPFRGVKMADIRAELHKWLESENIPGKFPPDAQKDLALNLLRETYCEDKLAGILFLKEVLIPSQSIDCAEDLPRFAALFEEGHIYEWNTCDWFCVKALGPLALQQGEPCARAISAWRRADNLWQRRAAGVAFVNLAPQGEANFPGFSDMLLKTCETTVQDSERFAQTGTGWVLRELSIAEPERVAGFVEAHIKSFSSEALKQATAKLPQPDQVRLRRMYKELLGKSR